MKDWLQKYAFVAFVFVCMLWCLRKCQCNSGDVKESVRFDTVWNKSDTIIRYVPIAYRIVYRDTAILHDTLQSFDTVLQQIDTSRVIQQYFATRYYDDTKQIKYGEVTIFDTVSQNRIIGRGVYVDQDIPTITKTVTESKPKRIVAYAGIIGMGNKQYFPYACGLTFDLKLKNDFMLGTGALITHERTLYLISMKVPIRFRKR